MKLTITREQLHEGLAAVAAAVPAAVAVAAGLGPIAVATDGGGSTRIPASCNGVVGLKQSNGVVPHNQALDAFGAPLLVLAGIGVGICSSVIPYVCDQLAMSRLPRSSFALLLALLPASATIVGVIVLRPIPSSIDVLGVLLVMIGVALHKPSTV